MIVMYTISGYDEYGPAPRLYILPGGHLVFLSRAYKAIINGDMFKKMRPQ